ncbi:insulin receptor substrate 2 [Platysternon megacephalum]|uniref:Insulin receptor substrate 2 n=1 Tax=Platysternon megacephalum TaxID=55544 RepID=A0A4D9EP11_9SAUR|nr:insulin receptor substrate 2 [Platysternon megacephalum]
MSISYTNFISISLAPGDLKYGRNLQCCGSDEHRKENLFLCLSISEYHIQPSLRTLESTKAGTLEHLSLIEQRQTSPHLRSPGGICSWTHLLGMHTALFFTNLVLRIIMLKHLTVYTQLNRLRRSIMVS